MASSAAASPFSSAPPSHSWSDLPQDLLIRIASLQSFLVGLFRFRSVCRSWRSAARAAAAQNLLPRLLSPFLMSRDEADPLTWLFYCVREGKLHRLRFPDDSPGWRCCGSSHGWLAMLGPGVGALLFHPFSGARAELPPLTTLPGVRPLEADSDSGSGGGGDGPEFHFETPWNDRGDKMIMTVGAEALSGVYVEKAVLAMDASSDPVPTAVVLLLHDFGGLVCARPGDEAWKVLPTPPGVDSFRDAVYHGGLFYGLSFKHELVFTIDLFSGDRLILQRFPPSEWTYCGSGYLAVLPSGLILQARRETRHGPDPAKTWSFQVLRLNMEEPKKWVKVKALRGISLFLDRSCSAALYSSLVSGKCRGNCIYFSNDDRFPGYDRDEYVFSDTDFGLFRLEDMAVEWGFPAGAEVTMKRPVWVLQSN